MICPVLSKMGQYLQSLLLQKLNPLHLLVALLFWVWLPWELLGLCWLVTDVEGLRLTACIVVCLVKKSVMDFCFWSVVLSFGGLRLGISCACPRLCGGV